ncbi:MAG: glycoside hydrolase family 10 protein [Eubacteriales bacterium]
MRFKTALIKFVSLFLAVVSIVPVAAFADDGGQNNQREFFIDAINATRWDNTSVIYTGIPTTGQNQYGHNVVVDKNGKVTDIIPGGDIKGKDLAVPEGGMVVSATGQKATWLNDNIKLGDYISYDPISSRILVSSNGEFAYGFSVTHTVTGFNQPRYSNTFIIYNKPGTTQTNGYGYEAVVDKNGIVIQAGGNNNTVPEGGFVVSAIEQADRSFLKMYGILGARITISADKKSITIDYDTPNFKTTLSLMLSSVQADLDKAKEEYKLVFYNTIQEEIDRINGEINTLRPTYTDRNQLYNKLIDLSFKIVEHYPSEVRSVWHESVEKNQAEVAKVVKTLKELNINQLCLGIGNGQNALFPMPDYLPFKQKTTLRGKDILQYYVDECKSAGIELIITVPVYVNGLGFNTSKKEWIIASNSTGGNNETGSFFNPAHPEYKAYFLEYIAYIYKAYDIDGLQLDYIRYPESANGLDYGYDSITEELFIKAYPELEEGILADIAQKTTSHPRWNDWIEFKASIITDMVKSVRELTDELRPDIYLSAAVASATALYLYCQDTAGWMEAGLLDAIYPMTYGEGVIQGRIGEFSGYTGDNAYLYMGSGTYLDLSDKETHNQVLVSRYNADGIAFFEYNAYVSHGTGEFMKKYAYYNSAYSPTLNAGQAASALLEFIEKRLNDVIIPLGGLDEEKAEEVKHLLISINDADTAAKTAEQIRKIVAGEKAEQVINEDLDRLIKIFNLSKDTEKQEYLEKKNNDESSLEESEEESAAESSIDGTTEETSKNNEKADKSKALLYIIAGVIAAGLIAAAVIFIIRKNKA